jgi:succinate-acetate transporter protein
MTARSGQPRESVGEYSFWREHTHINLSPVAAPSILGLFGFAVATFMVAGNLAGWYGDSTTTPLILAPFAFTFGGIAQFLAGMWSYRARDALATGFHGMWGAFWIAYGIYQMFVALGVLPPTAASQLAATAFGFWFIGLAAVTWIGVVAAAAENAAVTLVLLAVAIGATLLAIGLIVASTTISTIAAYFLIASAVLAWYTGSAMVLNATYKRVILPMGIRGAETNRPGRTTKAPIEFEFGEPGVKVGQ